MGLVVKSSIGRYKEVRFNEYPAYSLRLLNMDKATAARAYFASERKTTKKILLRKLQRSSCLSSLPPKEAPAT